MYSDFRLWVGLVTIVAGALLLGWLSRRRRVAELRRAGMHIVRPLNELTRLTEKIRRHLDQHDSNTFSGICAACNSSPLDTFTALRRLVEAGTVELAWREFQCLDDHLGHVRWQLSRTRRRKTRERRREQALGVLQKWQAHDTNRRPAC